MFGNIITEIICKTFEKEVKRCQIKAEKKFGMLVSFFLTCYYEKEEGYRFLDIILYAPTNYVGVLVKERWNVIPLNEIEYNEDQGENLIKKGCDYRKGGTEWKLAAYHDSCWRDGVSKTILDNAAKIKTLSGMDWYEKIEMTPELLETFSNLTLNRENSFYKVDEGVLKF